VFSWRSWHPTTAGKKSSGSSPIDAIDAPMTRREERRRDGEGTRWRRRMKDERCFLTRRVFDDNASALRTRKDAPQPLRERARLRERIRARILFPARCHAFGRRASAMRVFAGARPSRAATVPERSGRSEARSVLYAAESRSSPVEDRAGGVGRVVGLGRAFSRRRVPPRSWRDGRT